jgi:hypothetical protein
MKKSHQVIGISFCSAGILRRGLSFKSDSELF